MLKRDGIHRCCAASPHSTTSEIATQLLILARLTHGYIDMRICAEYLRGKGRPAGWVVDVKVVRMVIVIGGKSGLEMIHGVGD